MDSGKKYGRSAVIISLSLISVLALRVLLSTLYSAASRTFSLNAYADTLISGVAYIIMICLPCIFLALTEKTGLNDVMAPWKEENADYLPYITLRGMGFIAMANIAASYFMTLLDGIGVKNAAPESDIPFGKEQVFGIILIVIFEAVLPGFLEEIFFRGFIMKHLLKYGESCAVIVSALCFGLIHIYPTQIIFAFLVGLVIAKYDIKYGSIKIGIILHMLNNYMSCMFSLAAKYMDPTAHAAMVLSVFLTLIVLGIISGFVIRRYDRRSGTVSDGAPCEQNVPAYKFILHPLMLLFYAAIAFNIWILVK